MVSSLHVVSTAPSSSWGGLLTLFPCSSMGSIPQQTVLHKLLQREPFPWAAVVHKLPQRVSLPQGAVLQEQTSPAWVPHGVTSPANKPALARASFTPWAHRSWQEPAPACVPCRVTVSLRHIHLLWRGVLHRLQVDICSTVDLRGLQRESLLHHGLHHRLQGNPCSGAWSTSSPFFFTGLGVCRAVSLTYSHSLWLQLCRVFFPHFRNMLSQRCYDCCLWARSWPAVDPS